MKAYRIKNWEDRENADTRKYVDLLWFRNKVKLIGEGLGYTLAAPNGRGPHLYGMFKLIEQIAAGGRLEQRGWLYRNGSPLDAVRIANLLRLPVADCEEALTFFSTPPMDWLELADYPGDSPELPPPVGRTPGNSPGNPPDTVRTPEEMRQPTDDRPTVVQRPKLEEEETSQGAKIAEYPQVLKFIADWPGEPASGAPVIPKRYAEEWLAQMSGRERWPRDWRQKLVADWRVAFRTWNGTKKNASRTRERWQVEKDLETVREEIRLHPKMTWPGNKPMPEKITAQFATLVEQRAALEKELKEQTR